MTKEHIKLLPLVYSMRKRDCPQLLLFSCSRKAEEEKQVQDEQQQEEQKQGQDEKPV